MFNPLTKIHCSVQTHVLKKTRVCQTRVSHNDVTLLCNIVKFVEKSKLIWDGALHLEKSKSCVAVDTDGCFFKFPLDATSSRVVFWLKCKLTFWPLLSIFRPSLSTFRPLSMDIWFVFHLWHDEHTCYRINKGSDLKTYGTIQQNLIIFACPHVIFSIGRVRQHYNSNNTRWVPNTQGP